MNANGKLTYQTTQSNVQLNVQANTSLNQIMVTNVKKNVHKI